MDVLSMDCSTRIRVVPLGCLSVLLSIPSIVDRDPSLFICQDHCSVSIAIRVRTLL
jgi:hypothetical protein